MNDAGPTLQSGATLAGRWQISDFIGRGELGEVYGVRDTHGGADQALKLFSAQGLTRPEVWSAFQSAVRSVSAVGSEGVARASDFGIDANSHRPFYVCERVSWPSLARHSGPLSPQALSQALGVIARALDAAHGAGVVHRNLKPQNVFISPDNPSWVRITDFGVSILRSAAPVAPGWGAEIGWHGADAADPAQRATPAMDIFELGLVCFFALTRQSPFLAMRGSPVDPQQLWRELSQPLVSLSVRAGELGATLDPSLDPWFARALAAAPSDRFHKASEMADAFTAIVRTGRTGVREIPDALPGIAAAIPQPLVFQPEHARPVPHAAHAHAPPPAHSPSADAIDPELIPGLPSHKKSKLTTQLFIGGAVLCFTLTAAGLFALYRARSNASAEVATSAVVSAAPAPTAVEAPPLPASAAPDAGAPVAKARFECVPGPCEWVVCDGKNIRGLDKEVEIAPGEHACSASRYGLGSKALIFTAKPGETAQVSFELPMLPAGAAKKAPPPEVTPAAKAPAPAKKTDAKATVAAKPATSTKATASTKAPATAKPGAKKKCGTFINPCK